MSFVGETIWIIGASSGIGKALAIELADQGAQLLLSARTEEKLEDLKKIVGDHHRIYPLDVSDAGQVKRTVEAIKASTPTLDRVLLFAAIYKPQPVKDIDVLFAQHLMQVNVMGALYVTENILPIFEEQGAGQLALCGSVAGYTGLPNGQPYSASKAAVISFAESLYCEMPKNIDIKLISPGFVETPMTDKNDFDMPMVIKPEEAAKAIAKGLKKKSFEIHFPKKFTYLVKIIASLPYWLKLPITKKFDKKPEKQ